MASDNIKNDDDLSLLAQQIAGFIGKKISRSRQINYNLDNEYEYLHYGTSIKSAAENRNIKRIPSGSILGVNSANPNKPPIVGA